MNLNNFHYALSLAELLYDIEMQDDKFEEIALIAYLLIGNKRCKLYRYSTCLDKCLLSLELPCNCDILEAVTTDFEDFQHVSNIYEHGLPLSFSTEQYIEGRKAFKSPLYISGKYIPYERVGNTLYFTQYYHKINILYKGLVLDDDGLPELTDKEALAIATYCAYILKYKEGLRANNSNILNIANTLKALWLVLCDLARIPESLSQNEWDEILDAKNSWDRKILNRSYKVIK